MERRREKSTGILLMLAAVIVTALAVWILWSMAMGGEEAPSRDAVLVYSEGEGRKHG